MIHEVPFPQVDGKLLWNNLPCYSHNQPWTYSPEVPNPNPWDLEGCTHVSPLLSHLPRWAKFSHLPIGAGLLKHPMGKNQKEDREEDWETREKERKWGEKEIFPGSVEAWRAWNSAKVEVTVAKSKSWVRRGWKPFYPKSKYLGLGRGQVTGSED